MNILKKIIERIYENNLNKNKIISQLRRYHDKKYINMELLSMLLGVFKVQETRVKDIMIPRTNMVIIKKNSSIEEILPLIIKSSHSRFPVILENKDEIVGILLAKDLLRYVNKRNDSFNIEEIIRPNLTDSDLIFSEEDIEVTKKKTARAELGELAGDTKLDSDQDIVIIGDKESIKKKLIRNDNGVILLKPDESPKLKVSLRSQSFTMTQYRRTIDTEFKKLVGKL